MGLAGYLLAVWDSGTTLEHHLAGTCDAKLFCLFLDDIDAVCIVLSRHYNRILSFRTYLTLSFSEQP